MTGSKADGAATPLNLHEIRTTQIRLLSSLGEFCETHGLTYYLGWGTLLGAIRHQGYIPWDDDIDVMMPRDDYDRLLSLVSKGHLLGSEVSVGAPETDPDWPNPYIKLVDDRSRLEDVADEFDIGVYIDVFPIDGFPQGWIAEGVFRRTWRTVGGLMALQIMRPRAGRARFKTLLTWFFKLILRRIPRRHLMRSFNRLARSHAFSSHAQVGVVTGPSLWSVAKTALDPPASATFEGHSFPIPRDYDAVLTAIYGDYMTLPPVEKQVRHHAFTAYVRD